MAYLLNVFMLNKCVLTYSKSTIIVKVRYSPVNKTIIIIRQ